MKTLLYSILALFVAIALYFYFFEPQSDSVKPRLNVMEALSTDDTVGFERIYGPRKLIFPQDHGIHDGFKTEWWYFTGVLFDSDSNKYGYQLTFFKSMLPNLNLTQLKGDYTQLQDNLTQLESDSTQLNVNMTQLNDNLTPLNGKLTSLEDDSWRTNHIFMAHFAVSDVSNGNFYQFERFSRPSAGISGVLNYPFKAWVEDWTVFQTDSTDYGDVLPDLKLIARAENVVLSLDLHSLKQLILQGNAGYSQKSPLKGNSSLYYSSSRILSEGFIELNGKRTALKGNSWFDREWSTSFLDKNQAGWDWFSIIFDNYTELMLYRMRNKDGSTSLMTAGTLINRDGTSLKLNYTDLKIVPTRFWDDGNGSNYPLNWLIEIPSLKYSIRIEPALDRQVLNGVIKYWEGAINAYCDKNGTLIHGYGFMELTGY